MLYFVFIREFTDGRCQPIKVHAEEEVQARGRVEAHAAGLAKLHLVGSAEDLAEGQGLYEKACTKALALEAKRRAKQPEHKCDAVTAKLF